MALQPGPAYYWVHPSPQHQWPVDQCKMELLADEVGASNPLCTLNNVCSAIDRGDATGLGELLASFAVRCPLCCLLFLPIVCRYALILAYDFLVMTSKSCRVKKVEMDLGSWDLGPQKIILSDRPKPAHLQGKMFPCRICPTLKICAFAASIGGRCLTL
jgi:hypothetical protein